MRKQTKMVLSLLLAALLTASSAAVFADQPTTAGEIAEEQTAPPIDGTPVVVKLGDVFFDVPTGSELEKAVSKLKEAGVLHGYEDGSFRAANSLTRAEFCKMVNKLFGYTAKAQEAFPDVTAENWYYDDALIAKQQGYIAGYEDGTFRGSATVSREQVCRKAGYHP